MVPVSIPKHMLAFRFSQYRKYPVALGFSTLVHTLTSPVHGLPLPQFPYNPGIWALSCPFLSSSFGPLSSLALFSNLSSLSLSTSLAQVPSPQLFLFSHGAVQSGCHVQFTTFCLALNSFRCLWLYSPLYLQ